MPTSTSARGGSPETILIFDREGMFGELLAQKLVRKHLVIFITGLLTGNFDDENLIKIPITSKIPQIPDNTYSRIFIVDDGKKELKSSLPSFLKKSQLDKSSLIFISSVRRLTAETLDHISDSPQRVKLALLGDLFGDGKVYDSHSVIGKFYESAKNHDRLQVEEEGLNYSMPIYDDDAVSMVLELAFEEASGKIFYIFPDHPVSDISLARMIKKIHPDISIDFVKRASERNYYLPEGGTFPLTEHYKTEDKIKTLNFGSEGEPVRKQVLRKERPRFYSFKTFWIFSTLLFIFMLPLFSTGFYSLLGIYSLNSSKQNIEKGKLEKARADAKRGYTFFNIAHKSSELLVFESSLVGLSNPSKKIRSEVSLGKEVASAVSYLIEAGEKLKNIYNGKSLSPKEDFGQSKNLLKSSILVFRKIETGKAESFEFVREIKKLEPILEMFVSSAEVSDTLLGFVGI